MACAAAIVGDITPTCGVSKEEKAQLEADAIQDIQKLLGAESSVGTSVLLPCSHTALYCSSSTLIDLDAARGLSLANTLLLASIGSTCV